MSKLVPLKPPALENDFGEKPLLLARVTDDLAQIGVLGLFGSILATVALGGFALPLGLVITAWDIAYAYRFKQHLKPGMEGHLDAIQSLLRGEISSVEEFDQRCAGTLLQETRQTIETTAAPVHTLAIAPAEVATAPNPDPQIALKFLLSLTTAPLQPVIIAGLPGSGKGIMAAMALSLGAKHHGLRFWLFNAKPKLEEAGYWLWAEKHYLKNRLQADEELFADLMAVLEEFGAEGTRRNDQPGEYPPFVLLLEEVNALTGLLTPKQRQVFKAKITALASLLRGCKMALWLSGQSITLEDLGLTGKSNRAMFTAISAVGAEREAVGAICQPLGIPVDLSKLVAGQRYWLTASSSFPALPAPAVPQFSDWAAVPNVVDLRPGAAIDQPMPTVESVFEAEAESPDPPASAASLPRRRPKIYRPTQIGKQEVPEAIAQLIEQHSADPKLVDFLRLLATKQPGNTFDLRSLQGTQWAKRNGRAKEDIEPVLIEAISLGLLTEIGSGEYRVEALRHGEAP